MEIDTNSDERIEALKLCSMMLNCMNVKIKESNNGLKKKDYSSVIFPGNVYRALISIVSCFFTIRPGRKEVKEKKDKSVFLKQFISKIIGIIYLFSMKELLTLKALT